jgi:hypothetical protein
MSYTPALKIEYLINSGKNITFMARPSGQITILCQYCTYIQYWQRMVMKRTSLRYRAVTSNRSQNRLPTPNWQVFS